jgi:segregation and condensation protein B
MFFGRQSKPVEEPPFRAVVRPAEVSEPTSDAAAEPAAMEPTEAGWSVDDIEAAYLRALEAAETIEPADAPPADIETETDPAAAISANEPGAEYAADARDNAAGADAKFADDEPLPNEDEPRRVTPRQIVEALLFVGGRPLTSRQLADVLGGTHTPEIVDETVNDLNAEYARQARPYEVRLGEGGYRLDLRPEYDKVRGRVFGIGPREVKLAQNALEVLALVAYQQPVSKLKVEDSGIKGASGLLRQLLRRELIVLQRSDDDEPDAYRTTARFLELFGLRSLADLPQPEAVNLR